MAAPVSVKPIPAQTINELAAYGPIDFKDFIQTPDQSPFTFKAELKNGDGLPQGLIFTTDGFFTGIPAKGTIGLYEVLLTAENEDGKIEEKFVLTIKPGLLENADYLEKIKTQVWEALQQQLPLPDLQEIYDRPITLNDIYYLLERWGVVTIWDAFNLESPGEKKLLDLEGLSEHYYVYDRGSCIVGTPKDLFTYKRTIEDGLQTARIMAREAHQRGWTVELTGFEKMTRAAWVEIQRLNDATGKRIEVMNYNPTPDDLKLYTNQTPLPKIGD